LEVLEADPLAVEKIRENVGTAYFELLERYQSAGYGQIGEKQHYQRARQYKYEKRPVFGQRHVPFFPFPARKRLYNGLHRHRRPSFSDKMKAGAVAKQGRRQAPPLRLDVPFATAPETNAPI
jgi:hypothetical protein